MAWMIYGAYGYTGRLVTALASERGELPVLAGRDERQLSEQGERFELDHRAFGLEDPTALAQSLDGIDLVAHCAGPFSATANPMVDACIATGTHYLDITGEIDVLEAVLARHDEAVSAGVLLLPGSGFDVVPSDCLAAMLHEALPAAVRLELALRLDGGPSPGTAKTAMESLGAAPRGRVDGRIATVPNGRRQRKVTFADGEASASAVSWGDVATAYHSTGIGDVVVYAALPPGLAQIAALAAATGPLARSAPVQKVLKRLVGRLPGPTTATRVKSAGQLWGRVTDSEGRSVTGTMTTPNGYDTTADAVVTVARRVLGGGVEPGARTPSQALGADFATELDGVKAHLG
jgi:short subunit dehydrogenase-like uncharacterized protein